MGRNGAVAAAAAGHIRWKPHTAVAKGRDRSEAGYFIRMHAPAWHRKSCVLYFMDAPS